MNIEDGILFFRPPHLAAWGEARLKHTYKNGLTCPSFWNTMAMQAHWQSFILARAEVHAI